MSELKPCPFCGSEKSTIEPVMIESFGTPRYCVICSECGANSSVDLGRSGAVELWNNRPIEGALKSRVEELEAELTKLYEENRWIPVEERLPDVSGFVSDRVEVCIRGRNGEFFVSDLHYCYVPADWAADDWNYRAGWYGRGGDPTDEIITHWRPAPVPPKEAA